MTAIDDRAQPLPHASGQMTNSAAAEIERLRTTFESGRSRSLDWRLAQLCGVETMMDEREDEIAQALAVDLGRPAVDAWLGDIASVRAEATYARERLRRLDA